MLNVGGLSNEKRRVLYDDQAWNSILRRGRYIRIPDEAQKLALHTVTKFYGKVVASVK